MVKTNSFGAGTASSRLSSSCDGDKRTGDGGAGTLSLLLLPSPPYSPTPHPPPVSGRRPAFCPLLCRPLTLDRAAAEGEQRRAELRLQSVAVAADVFCRSRGCVQLLLLLAVAALSSFLSVSFLQDFDNSLWPRRSPPFLPALLRPSVVVSARRHRPLPKPLSGLAYWTGVERRSTNTFFWPRFFCWYGTLTCLDC